MTSAAAFAGVLALGAMATQAQAFNNNGDDDPVGNEDSYNNQSGNEIDIDDSFNDNREYKTEVDTDIDVDVKDSFNDNREYKSEVDVDDSFNDNREYKTEVDDSFNDNREYKDSFNDERDYDDSFNDNREYKSEVDVDIKDSFNDEREYKDSFNTSNDTWTIRVSLNNQDLSANVSDIKVDMSEDNDGPQNARLRTGNIHQGGGSFAGFAGIQTVTNNTGLASIGQAATAVSANANVSFGGTGGGGSK
jgi:hypothetical protein